MWHDDDPQADPGTVAARYPGCDQRISVERAKGIDPS
jgi:hypothetical protein